MRTPVGTQLAGRYRLDAEVGHGGMSTVYRAFDTVLERQVAIKLMHREIASDSDQLERFRREARAVAQLNHPHVVGVIDVGEDGSTPFIVLEYVEGETLKDRIRRAGRLPVTEAVAYAIEIARALNAAHARQIVHRDVKPQNVLIDGEGTARVTDFGIARSLEEEGLTADGRVLGTTDYVSPEQALGHPVTGQSDLYSLGIVLFEMLTGDVPFHGESQVAVAMKHVREELPDVQLRRPEVSSALAAVVDRATAKDLGERYASAEQLIDDLAEVLGIETARTGQVTGEVTTVLRTLPPSAQRRVPQRVRHPARLLAAGVLVFVAATVAFVLLADRAERGTGSSNVKAPPGLKTVSLGQGEANDFDPLGDNREEHPDQVKLVVDRQPDTFWDTETYTGSNLGKDGVGVYVDARPDVRARALEVLTRTPGWRGWVYGAPNGGTPDELSGFRRLAPIRATERRTRVTLDLGRKRLRYYLVWITALPPGEESVEISEIRLFR